MSELVIQENGLIKSDNAHAIIMGTASSSIDLAPLGDYTADFFTLAWRLDMKRSDVKFDVHRIDAERQGLPANYFDLLANQKVPVYLQDKHPKVPNSNRIPIELLVNTFGEYFASSIGYMIAIAILSGYKRISLYGIDLLDDSEYSYQRPNAEYLLGWAAGKGIEVIIPNNSCLLKFNHRYGYDKSPDTGPFSEEFLQNKLKEYNTMHLEHSNHAIAADGARQAIAGLIDSAQKGKKGKIL